MEHFINRSNKRGDQPEIALQYLPLKFDVMTGGGLEYFSADKRKDKQDVFAQFKQQDYEVALTRKEMMKAAGSKPLLGVFHEGGLPYLIDRAQSDELQKQVPTLAEMTKQAVSILKNNKKGFVLQVEAGKVDWAHANDIAALLYDQIAFDEAIKLAINFGEADKETLVIITTDHGNANPGLFYGEKANKNFDSIHYFKQTNEWVLNGISKNSTEKQVIERFEAAQGIILKKEDAANLLKHYTNLNEEGVYNPYKLPFKQLAQLQTSYTSVGWSQDQKRVQR